MKLSLRIRMPPGSEKLTTFLEIQFSCQYNYLTLLLLYIYHSAKRYSEPPAGFSNAETVGRK